MKSNRIKNLRLITPTTLIVGVDGHSKSNTAAFSMASGEEPIRPVKFSNDRKGFIWFIEKVNWIKQKHGLDKVLFVLEPNGPYWQLLARFLSERNESVRVVSAYQVKKNREADNPSPDKNDFKDARSAAELGRQGKFNQTALPEQSYEDLKILTRLRESLMQERSACKHRIRAALVRAFPELGMCASNLFCKSIVALIRVAPTAESVVRLGVDGVLEVVKSASKGRFALKKAKQIVETAQQSVGFLEATVAVRLEFESILDIMDALGAKIESVECQMTQLLDGLEESALIQSIPGVGTITTAAILGETGGLRQYQNPSQIKKLAGLDLVGSQSGAHRGQLKVSRRGRKLMRKVLYQAAVVCLTCNSVLSGFYKRLIEPTRANRLKKKQAVVAVMGKIVEIMFSIVRSGNPFSLDYCWTAPGSGSIKEQIAA